MGRTFYNLITLDELRNVRYDTNVQTIELFPLGGIKFYEKEKGIDFNNFDIILHHVFSEDIVNFKILGAFHSIRLPEFLHKYKRGFFKGYDTKRILDNIQELKLNIENRVVLRCSGQLYGHELKNMLLLQGKQEYSLSDISRNSIIRELGNNIGSITNWNTAFSGNVELSYDFNTFNPIANIILGFLCILSDNYLLTISRIVIAGDRVHITLSRLSNITKTIFYQDNEKKVFTYGFDKDYMVINGIPWEIEKNSIPARFFELLCLYFSKNNKYKVSRGELIDFHKSINSTHVSEVQIKSDNIRKNYLPKINEYFSKMYDGKLLDMKGELIEAKNIRNIPRLYPFEY